MNATLAKTATQNANTQINASIGQSYACLAAAAHVLIGAIAWGSHISVAPAAAAITLASCVALWTAFASVARSSRLTALALSLTCILVTSFATHTEALPTWLLSGPWNPLLQSCAVCATILIGSRRSPSRDRDGNQGNLAHSQQDDTASNASFSASRSQGGRWSTGKRCAVAAAVAIACYLVALPVGEEIWDRTFPPPTSSVLEDMTLAESMRLRAVQVFAGAWAFAFGACVGSFLNVLVYRQPRGESVLTRPSACPSCSTKIETRDNIPVAGWLVLGGRCRSCQAPISARYPIVEAIVGTVFAILVFAELTSGGANLPVRRINTYTGFVWTIFYPKWDLIALTLYHFHLFVMLITWALMTIDRVAIPWRSMLTAWVIAITAPLAWNRLWIMPPAFVGEWAYAQPLPVVALAIAAGMTSGLALAIAISLIGLGRLRSLAAAFGLIGATLGWQATLSVGVVTIGCTAMWRLAKSTTPNVLTLLPFVTFLHHLAWRSIVGLAESFVASVQ